MIDGEFGLAKDDDLMTKKMTRQSIANYISNIVLEPGTKIWTDESKSIILRNLLQEMKEYANKAGDDAVDSAKETGIVDEEELKDIREKAEDEAIGYFINENWKYFSQLETENEGEFNNGYIIGLPLAGTQLNKPHVKSSISSSVPLPNNGWKYGKGNVNDSQRDETVVIDEGYIVDYTGISSNNSTGTNISRPVLENDTSIDHYLSRSNSGLRADPLSGFIYKDEGRVSSVSTVDKILFRERVY